MSRNLVTNYRTEKNKLESAQVIRLFQIYTASSLYYAEYSENVVFGGQTYVAVPISSSPISENSKGEIASVSITIGSANRDIIAIIQGEELIDVRVDMLEVFANNLGDSNAYVGDTFNMSTRTSINSSTKIIAIMSL